MNEYLAQRDVYSKERLARLQEALASHPDIRDIHNFCIYTAGSFGRGDAAKGADLDVFMFKLGSARNGENKVTISQQSLAFSALIKTAKELEFPKFTDDGKYLEIHYLDDMFSALGDRDDDKNNYFTARMLLLLESKPIFGSETYRKLIDRIISDIYLRDYKNYKENFRPLFLLNDIARYWKTICLNYEARRTRTDSILQPKAKPDKRFKLKYSRLLTCYSFIASLIAMSPGEANKENLIKVIEQGPWDRLRSATEKKSDPKGSELFENLMHEYEWFLKKCLEDLEFYLRQNKKEAFDTAAKFGDYMFDLLDKVKYDKDALRYLTI